MKKIAFLAIAVLMIGCAAKSNSPAAPAQQPMGKGGYLQIVDQSTCSGGSLSYSVTVNGVQTVQNLQNTVSALDSFIAPANTTLSYSIGNVIGTCSGTSYSYPASISAQGDIPLNGTAVIYFNASGYSCSVSVANGTY